MRYDVRPAWSDLRIEWEVEREVIELIAYVRSIRRITSVAAIAQDVLAQEYRRSGWVVQFEVLVVAAAFCVL